MPVGQQELVHRQTFGGGQIDSDLGISGDFTTTQETFMSNNEAVELKNVYVDNRGYLRKRPGTTRINSVSGNAVITGIFDFALSGIALAPSNIRTANDTGQFSSIYAVDKNTIFVSYYDVTNGDLLASKTTNRGLTWTTTSVDTTDNVGQYTSIYALDADTVFVSYLDVTNSDLMFCKSTSGFTWGTPVVVSDTDVGKHTTIYAVDSSNIYITYQIDVASYHKYFVKSSDGGATWGTPVAIQAGSLRDGMKMHVVSSTTIYVVYYDAGGNLVFEKSTDSGATFGSPVNIKTGMTSDAVGQNVDIFAVDANNVYVAYYMVAGNDLEFAKSTDAGATWATSAVDTTGDVGTNPGIFATGVGTIVITYRDVTNANIKFAKSTDGGTTWTLTTVDSTGDVGTYTAVHGIDADNIFASYYDVTNGNMKFAASNTVFTLVTGVEYLWYVSTAGALTAITWAGGAFGDSVFDTAVYNNLVILTNSRAQIPQKWDANTDTSTTADLGGSPPAAKYVAVFRNFVFLAGDPDNPSKLYFSELNAPETWGSTNNIDISKDDGDEITGIKTYYKINALVIFKRHSIHLLTGASIDTFVRTTAVSGWGCLSHLSILEIDGLLSFYSERGPSVFDGSTARVMSEKLRNTLATSSLGGVVNINRVNRVGAAYDDLRGLYLVSVATDNSHNNRTYAYNLVGGGWTYWEEQNTVDIFTAIQKVYDPTISQSLVDNQPRIWLGQNGYISRLNTETDITDTNDDLDTDTEVQPDIRCQHVTFGRPGEEKIFTKAVFHVEQFAHSANPTQVEVRMYADWSTTALATTTLRLRGGAAAPSTPIRDTFVLPMNIEARSLQLRVLHNHQGPFDLAAIDVYGRSLNRRFI